MAEVQLAFLWHQHQPYYPDDVAGENSMPWVRLHGVKDYYGMALHLLEFPEMRCMINPVPSRWTFRERLSVPARQFFYGGSGTDDCAIPALCRAVSAARCRPKYGSG